MRRRGLLNAVTWAGVALLCASCGLFGDDSPSTSVSLVAGGGDDPQGTTAQDVRLNGTVSDLEAHEGTVHLLVYDGQSRDLVTIDPDGAVNRTPLDGVGDARHVAAGPAGEVFVADSDAVYQVDGDVFTPRVVVAGADVAQGADAAALPDDMSIAGVAVDGDGRVVCTATFVGSGPDEGSEPVLTKVFRLDDGELEHLAGADSADLDGTELSDVLASPPSDVDAMDLALDGYGGEGEVAAAADGSVLLGGTSSVLRIDPDGGVDAILSDGERAFPDEPYGDEADAVGFGGSWVGSDIAVEGETVAVVDRFVGLEQERTDVAAFGWGDELGEPAQELADRIVRGLAADASIDSDDDTAPYGHVAVLVHGGRAATAMAHVAGVALDGDRLYVAGETSEDGPASRILVVSAPVPDDWR